MNIFRKILDARMFSVIVIASLMVGILFGVKSQKVSAADTFSLWDNTTLPSLGASGDTRALEVGVKFRSSVDGYITGLKYYKGVPNTGTHIAHLWSATGTQLAQATYTNETRGGWQTVTLSTPVAIKANTVYVASYHMDGGQYAVNRNYFASGRTNSLLYAFSSGEVSGGNGVYIYGASAFPNQTFGQSNYWVDVVFSPALQGTATPVPTSTPTAVPTSTSTNVPTSSPTSTLTDVPTATPTSTSTDVPTATPTSTSTNAPTATPTSTSTNVPTATSTDIPSPTMTNTPVPTITPTATMTDTLIPTAPIIPPIEVTSTPTTAPIISNFSLWDNTTLPSLGASGDTRALEVGVKFRSSVDGYITGLKYYKGVPNTGTHIAHLWSATGTQLVQATYTNETSSGWQTVILSNPVAIKANTVYVASYHMDGGQYAVNRNYFASGRTNSVLYAFSSGEVSGGNGVYIYGASAFPNQTYGQSNYWVDVVFSTSADVPTPVPTAVPTSGPSATPSQVPTIGPTPTSTQVPTSGPSPTPTTQPTLPPSSGAIVINHNNTDVSKIPLQWIEAAKKLTAQIAHTSHGSQIIRGLQYLEDINPNLRIAVQTGGAPGLPADNTALRIYDGNNYGTDTYITVDKYWSTADGVNHTNSVLGSNLFNVSLFTFCGELEANPGPAYAQSYLSTLNGIQNSFPNMKISFVTGHAVSIGNSGNTDDINALDANNNAIRSFVNSNKFVLFDFNDIDRTDPGGTLHTDANDSCPWCTQWCTAHPADCVNLPTDCAHSHGLQCKLKGGAFWWMMARLAGWDGETQ